jgi:hypothetical protein
MKPYKRIFKEGWNGVQFGDKNPDMPNHEDKENEHNFIKEYEPKTPMGLSTPKALDLFNKYLTFVLIPENPSGYTTKQEKENAWYMFKGMQMTDILKDIKKGMK